MLQFTKPVAFFVSIGKPGFEFLGKFFLVFIVIFCEISHHAANEHTFEKGKGYGNCIYDFGANTMIGGVDAIRFRWHM